ADHKRGTVYQFAQRINVKDPRLSAISRYAFRALSRACRAVEKRAEEQRCQRRSEKRSTRVHRHARTLNHGELFARQEFVRCCDGSSWADSSDRASRPHSQRSEPKWSSAP